MPDVNILGTIHSDNVVTLNQLVSSTQGVIGMTTLTASSAAGSAAQLSWVESQLKAKPTNPDKPVKPEIPAKITKSAKLAQPTDKPSQGVIGTTKPHPKLAKTLTTSTASAAAQSTAKPMQGVIGTTKPHPKPATTPTTSTASAAAGSAAQLPQVDTELKTKSVKPVIPEKAVRHVNMAKPSTKLSNKHDSRTQQDISIPKSGKVNIMPFSVKLVHLTPDLINMCTTTKSAAQEPSSATPSVKQVNIELHKQPTMPKQLVTIAPTQPKPSTSKASTR